MTLESLIRAMILSCTTAVVARSALATASYRKVPVKGPHAS